jgi:hypothetical protein
MAAGLKGRMVALLAAATLVGGAVAVRVWLAATGGYSQGWSIPFRVASGIALFAGLLLAALTVAWPVRKPGGPAKPGGKGGAT